MTPLANGKVIARPGRHFFESVSAVLPSVSPFGSVPPSPPPSLPPLPPRSHLAHPAPLALSRRARTMSPAGAGTKARAYPDVEKPSPLRPPSSPLLLGANAQARVSCLRQQSIGSTSSARDPSPLIAADEVPPSPLESFQVAQELAELIYLETHKWHPPEDSKGLAASPSSSSAAVPNYRMSSHEEHSAAKHAAARGGGVWRVQAEDGQAEPLDEQTIKDIKTKRSTT